MEDILYDKGSPATVQLREIVQHTTKDLEPVLVLSIQQLQSLDEIFKMVESFVPYSLLKSNMSFGLISTALQLCSKIHDWDTLTI